MKKRVVKRAQARIDMLNLSEFLSLNEPAVALRFIDAVEEEITWLRRFPDSGEVWEEAPKKYRGLRIWPMKDFPNHLIFHRSTDNTLEIIRLRHGAQNWIAEFGE